MAEVKSAEGYFTEMQKTVNSVIKEHGYIQAFGLVEMLSNVVRGNFEYDFIMQRNKQIAERDREITEQ